MSEKDDGDNAALRAYFANQQHSEFEKVVATLEPRLRALLIPLAKGNPKIDIDGIIQEAFLKIHINLQNLKRHQKPVFWVLRVAKNLFLDSIKKEKNNASDISIFNSNDDGDGFVLNLIDCTTLGPFEEVDRKEVVLLMRSCLNRVPTELQLCWEMLFDEKRSVKEIAQMLGQTSEWVRYQRGKLIEMLRTLIAISRLGNLISEMEANSILFREIDGLKLDEIAVKLGISDKQVREYLRCANEKISTFWKER